MKSTRDHKAQEKKKQQQNRLDLSYLRCSGSASVSQS